MAEKGWSEKAINWSRTKWQENKEVWGGGKHWRERQLLREAECEMKDGSLQRCS